MEQGPRLCGAQTVHGAACKARVYGANEKCWIHRGPPCAVCLGPMSTPQANRTLPCNHTFHSRCVDRWKRSCRGDPTCPMCRVPFDLPTYRCRLIIERTSDNQRSVSDFDLNNINELMEGFGIDFRSLVPQGGTGRLFTDVHFTVEPSEVLEDILRELGLPVETGHFD